MKPDYYVSFNTYYTLTDEAIKQQKQLQKKYCYPKHLPPEFMMETIRVVGGGSSIGEIVKTYEIIRERPGDRTSKVLDFNELQSPQVFCQGGKIILMSDSCPSDSGAGSRYDSCIKIQGL